MNDFSSLSVWKSGLKANGTSSSTTVPLQSWPATLPNDRPCSNQGPQLSSTFLIFNMVILCVSKLALPDHTTVKRQLLISLLSFMPSAWPHISLLFILPPHQDCYAQSIITLSMNRECKLINIIGTDALELPLHFPFIHSPKLGRHNGGT